MYGYVHIITAMSHERHGLWNHWQISLLESLLRLAGNIYQTSILLIHCEGNHQWLADSLHKNPVMHIEYSCHEAISWCVILKTKGRQFDNFVVIGGTVSCRNDNLRCHQCRPNCQIDNLLFSVKFFRYKGIIGAYCGRDRDMTATSTHMSFCCSSQWLCKMVCRTHGNMSHVVESDRINQVRTKNNNLLNNGSTHGDI